MSNCEVDRIFELKEAGHKWSYIATRMRRPIETIRKRYYRETRARNARAAYLHPRAIIAHRDVQTTAGTTPNGEYQVQWVGTEETNWEPLSAVMHWEAYALYNLRIQSAALRYVSARVIE